MRKESLVAGLLTVVLAACGSAPTPAPATPGEPVALVTTSPSPTASPSPTPSPTAIATASPTATPTATPPPPPPPWKAYRSKRYHYRIKYPPDWVVTPGSSKLADMFDDFADDVVYVDRDTVSGIASISLTVTSERAYYKSHYKAKLLDDTKTTIGGWPARILRWKGSRDGSKLYIQLALVAKGHVGYFIRWYSDQGNEKADKSLFLKMLKTFRPTA